MAGYTKLFSTILASTIWREPAEVRVVWITMLAMSDSQGRVDGSVPGLADLARVSVEECQKALDCLSSPDFFSRTKELEGRRIKEIDGGWLILNYLKYRESDSTDLRKEQNREAQRRWREKHKLTVSKSNPRKPKSAQAEASAEAESNKTLGAGAPPTSDSDWISELSKNAAYEGIDVRREFGKMVAWTTTNKKQPTKRRFVNWLNRAERPISLNGHAAPQKPALNEPKGWKAWLNHNRPDSVYSVGGNSECHEWAKLPREAQEVVLAGLR